MRPDQLKIAFYAPLKPPDHPTPSGDRQVARLLIAALTRAGHQVQVASKLRAYLPDPGDGAALSRMMSEATAERDRIATLWQVQGAPDLWFCYHPYCKSPDLIGPELARRFALPWFSAEASLSSRRNVGIWAMTQAAVADAVAGAAQNFAMTRRDQQGLLTWLPKARVTALPPFLDLDALPPAAALNGNRIVTVAMMRSGDKMDSYRALAATLARLEHLDWRLAIAGDGPLRDQVRSLFPAGRVDWLGQLSPPEVAAHLAQGCLYLWPGCGEAYGMTYLEAGAAGLPVVAWATAGVPEVVSDGETGLLAPEGDTAALAAHVARLLADPALRQRLGQAARARVQARHGLDGAAAILDRAMRQA